MSKKVKTLLKICTISFLLTGILSFSIYTKAAEINSNEQKVINVVSGTFQYDGKTYKADPTYISQLRNELAAEGTDLTSEQANKAIQMVYDNLEAGIIAGYIVAVEEEEEIPEPKEEEEEIFNSNGLEGIDQDDTPSEDNPENKPEDNPEAQINGVIKTTGFSIEGSRNFIFVLGAVFILVLFRSFSFILSQETGEGNDE